MGRHVAGCMPEMDRLVDEACAGIGAAVEAANVPRLAGVVLGGGYGRGEGGVRGSLLSNDLDFFAITETGASAAEIAGVSRALEPISQDWTARLGIDVDFTVRTPWRIRHDQDRLMIQELLHGYFDVAGVKGEVLFAGVARKEPSEFPWMEAARLLMNRGMGLLFAKEEGRGEKGDFVARNINKCVLGAGDARLIARHAYRWRAEERAEAIGDDLYSAAVEWKFRPSERAVCDWETAREAWLKALDYVGGESGRFGSDRTLFSAVRWIVRRRTLGNIRSLGKDPVVRVLECVGRHVRERTLPCASLRRDWEIFN